MQQVAHHSHPPAFSPTLVGDHHYQTAALPCCSAHFMRLLPVYCIPLLCTATVCTAQVEKEAPLFGFEQEYTMLQKGSGMVLGWPEGGYPAPQGPFYCGVGANSVFGRPLAEAHMEACLEAGLTISGINAEVCFLWVVWVCECLWGRDCGSQQMATRVEGDGAGMCGGQETTRTALAGLWLRPRMRPALSLVLTSAASVQRCVCVCECVCSWVWVFFVDEEGLSLGVGVAWSTPVAVTPHGDLPGGSSQH